MPGVPNDDQQIKDVFMQHKESVIGIGLVLGVSAGVVYGAATDNMGLGVSIGTVIGLIVGAVIYTRLSAKPKE